jgi:hypothetical protein
MVGVVLSEADFFSTLIWPPTLDPLIWIISWGGNRSLTLA